jgi:hypothetical protein
MTRAAGEGKDPRDTVQLDGVNYRSTGVLDIVLPYSTRRDREFTALFIDTAWFYTDPEDLEWASGLMEEHVTVTWRLAYGRRYIKSLSKVPAEGAVTEPETTRRREEFFEDGLVGSPAVRYPWQKGPF